MELLIIVVIAFLIGKLKARLARAFFERSDPCA